MPDGRRGWSWFLGFPHICLESNTNSSMIPDSPRRPGDQGSREPQGLMEHSMHRVYGVHTHPAAINRGHKRNRPQPQQVMDLDRMNLDTNRNFSVFRTERQTSLTAGLRLVVLSPIDARLASMVPPVSAYAVVSCE
ncbi:hypothetical protein ACN47E_000233 [Coniothyrium glycines]